MDLIRNMFDKDKWFLLLARNGFFGNWDDEKFLKRTFQAKMGGGKVGFEQSSII